MKLKVFQLQQQTFSLPEEEQKLLTDYKNYYSLDFKIILNYMSKKSNKEA